MTGIVTCRPWLAFLPAMLAVLGARAESFACLRGLKPSHCLAGASRMYDPTDAWRSRSPSPEGGGRRTFSGGVIPSGPEEASACFHVREHLDGMRLCRGPGARFVLPAEMAGRVASVRIPEGLRVYASDTAENGPVRILSPDSPGAASLRGPVGRVFQVARTRIDCVRQCPLAGADSYALDALYGALWNDPQFPGKTFHFTFAVNRTTRFTALHEGIVPLRFSLDRGMLRVAHVQAGQETSQQMMLMPETRLLSLAFELEGERNLRYQILELDETRRIRRASPLAVLFRAEAPAAMLRHTFTLQSASRDLQLDSLSLAVAVGPRRPERSYGLAMCYAIPVLAIYNYVIQGRCDQPEAVVHYVKGLIAPLGARLLHVAGTLPSGMSASPAPGAQAVMPVLHRIAAVYTRPFDPFLLHGAARACGVRIESLLWPRRIMRRGGDGDPVACAYWTVDILVAFNRVFGTSWDAGFFRQTVSRILGAGTFDPPPGAVAGDAERLVQLVLNMHGRLQVDTLNVLWRGYGDAANLFYRSSFGTLMPEAIPPADVGRLFEPVLVGPPHSPAVGHYALDVSRFTPVPAFPRVWRNGGWADGTEDFQVAVFFPNEQRDRSRRDPAYQDAVSTLETWLAVFGGAGSDSEDSDSAGGAAAAPAEAPLHHWGGSIASGLLREMTVPTSPDTVLVAVRYQGRLASLLLGTLDGDQTVIDYVLSRPDSVLPPRTAASIQGGGRRAVSEFVRFCIGRGIGRILVHAVTRPSASLHSELGFRLIE